MSMRCPLTCMCPGKHYAPFAVSPKGNPGPWRLETVGARCVVAGILGIIGGLVVTIWVRWQAAILVGWGCGGSLLLDLDLGEGRPA